VQNGTAEEWEMVPDKKNHDFFEKILLNE